MAFIGHDSQRGVELQPTGQRARGISDASSTDDPTREKNRKGFYPNSHEDSQFQRFQWKAMFTTRKYIGTSVGTISVLIAYYGLNLRLNTLQYWFSSSKLTCIMAQYTGSFSFYSPL